MSRETDSDSQAGDEKLASGEPPREHETEDNPLRVGLQDATEPRHEECQDESCWRMAIQLIRHLAFKTRLGYLPCCVIFGYYLFSVL